MTPAHCVRPADRPPAMRIAGFDIQALLSGGEGQHFEIFLTRGIDGKGAAPHSHPWDETFFVLQGEVMFGVADQEQLVEAGSLLHVPAGERHWYRFGDHLAELLSVTSGREAAAMYRDLAELPADASPDDYRATARLHGQSARPEP